MTNAKPKIAIMMDEDSSRGGTHYDLSKNYFSAVAAAGAVPYGIPYVKDFAERAIREFDGFLSVGGFVAFPSAWYISGNASPFKLSERLAVEIPIMESFLESDKPVLGICHGMQLLAGLHGAKLRSDLGNTFHKASDHGVTLTPGSQWADIVRCAAFEVNSRHSEAIATVVDPIRVAAFAQDKVIEAIEIKGKRFALGCQWHQEEFWNAEHPGNRIFSAFVDACRPGLV